jgi:hypothetical protein
MLQLLSGDISNKVLSAAKTVLIPEYYEHVIELNKIGNVRI